jgi:hypothetical protein
MAQRETVQSVEFYPGLYDPEMLPVFDPDQAWTRTGWWNNQRLFRKGAQEPDVVRVSTHDAGNIRVVYSGLVGVTGLYPFNETHRFTKAREALDSVSALCAPNDTEAIVVINRLMSEQLEEEAAWKQKICEDMGAIIVGERGRLHVLLEATNPLPEDGRIEAKLGKLWGFACVADGETVPVVAGRDGSIGQASVPPLSFWLYAGTLE